MQLNTPFYHFSDRTTVLGAETVSLGLLCLWHFGLLVLNLSIYGLSKASKDGPLKVVG